jgi:hypothetical protein
MIRNVYIRITNEKGKREYLTVGWMDKKGKVTLFKGMPLPEWFEV